MKNDLDALFRDAERLRPTPELWRRIAAGSPLREPNPALEAASRRPEWLEIRYLRAAAVALAAGLLALAAFGLLRGPGGEPQREASAAAAYTAAEGDSGVFDPELLGWQADLGNYELVADEAGEEL